MDRHIGSIQEVRPTSAISAGCNPAVDRDSDVVRCGFLFDHEQQPPYDYIVLTAAITRPDLHSRVFPGYVRLIGSARVKWLINVDDVGTAHSVDSTVENLRRLLDAPNIDLEFIHTAGFSDTSTI